MFIIVAKHLLTTMIQFHKTLEFKYRNIGIGIL